MLKIVERVDRFYRSISRLYKRPRTPSGILILSCGGIGDTILFSHVLTRFVELTTPGEPVTLLLREDGAKVSFLFPNEVNILSINFKKLAKNLMYRKKIMKMLFDNNYRMVISTDYHRHPNLDESLIKACQAPQNVAMVSRPWAKYQTNLDNNSKYFSRLINSGPLIKDKILRWVDFSNELLGENRSPPLAVKKDTSLSERQTDRRSCIILNPFSAVRAKQSPLALFKELIATLPIESQIIITGTPSDLKKNQEFKSLLNQENVEFDCSSFSIIQNRILNARLVVSVDTAMAHLAIALGAPTLCLASAAYVNEIVPYAKQTIPDNAHFYFVPMHCQSCLGNCIYELEDNMFRCVAKLDASRVVQLALSLLD